MAILERFADIIKANINDLLDKCEDPAKMIDQYLRDLTEDLAEVKKETAAVMAEETRTRRMLEENTAEVKRYEELAKKALTAGNEGDARVFLGKKQQLADKAASLQATYDAELRERAAQLGVRLGFLSDYAAVPNPAYAHTLVVNYAGLDPARLHETMALLSQIFSL